MDTLSSSWTRGWKALDASGDGTALMRKVVAAYQEPQRKYHTLQHLSECVAVLEPNLSRAAEPGEVEIALWFHDAVYDIKAGDNERKSAEWAETALTEADVPGERIERIKHLIMATRHAALPEGQDQQLLVDVDLSILGAPRARFVEYEAQVRQEYRWVPDLLFRRRRREIIEDFLARTHIYSTPALREQYERQARENLTYSLDQLGGRIS